SGFRTRAQLRSRAPGTQAHRRLHPVLYGDVSGEHQSPLFASRQAREHDRLHQGREGELLHRFEVRLFRISEGSSAFPETLRTFRRMRRRTEYGEERITGAPAPYRAESA